MAPTPSFEITSDPRQSWIRGTINGIEVTRASFKEREDPYRRELIQIDTAPSIRGMVTPLALLRHLVEQAEPRRPLIDSPVNMNTDAGIAAIAAARRAGIAIYQFGSFRAGAGCMCTVSAQAS